jgi:methionine sulfoxide reductase heme-binding subunit
MSSTTLWYATRASGIVALVLLTATMVVGIAVTKRVRARNWPGFAQQELHRRISMLSVVFVGIHVLTSVLDTYVNIGWAALIVPFTSPYSRLWVGVGTVGLDLMLAVFISSLLRNRMKPTMWRALHWLAYLCWPIALAHTFGMGTDAHEAWVIALGGVCIASVLGAFLCRVLVSAKQRTVPDRRYQPGVCRKQLVLPHPDGGMRHGT